MCRLIFNLGNREILQALCADDTLPNKSWVVAGNLTLAIGNISVLAITLHSLLAIIAGNTKLYLKLPFLNSPRGGNNAGDVS